MCYVTNLDYKTDACKLTRSETCGNITFTWCKHAHPSTKSRDIIGAQSRSSYTGNVTVNCYNGHITSTISARQPNETITRSPKQMTSTVLIRVHSPFGWGSCTKYATRHSGKVGHPTSYSENYVRRFMK